MSWPFLAHYFRRTHLRFFSLVRSRKDHRGVDLISDVLPFGRLWYTEIQRNRLRGLLQPLTSAGEDDFHVGK